MKNLTYQTAILTLLILPLLLLAPKHGRAQSETLPSTAQSAQKLKGIPEGYMIIEGDILVPINLYYKQKPAATWETKFWPNGIVPFEFDATVTPTNQNNMLAAMAEWERVANVDFRARSNESDYLHIQDATNNSSQVGRQGGGQVVNIVSWNSRFIVSAR